MDRIWYGGDYNPEQWPERGLGRRRARSCSARASPWRPSASSPGRSSSRATGEFDFELARRRARPAARRRGARRPRDRDGVAAAVARARAPGDAAGHRGRRAPLGRQPAALLPQLAGLPALRGPAGPGARRAVRRAPGARVVAREQRVACHVPRDYSRRVRRGVPRLAGGEVRHGRGAERGLGHAVLVAGATPPSTRSCRRARRRPSRTRRSCSTSTASPPTPGSACYRGGGGDPARGLPRASRSRRTSWASSSGLDYWRHAEELDFVSDDHYPDPADPAAPVIAAATARPDPLARAAGPWILMEQATERRELAPAERGEAAGDAPAAVAAGGRPRRRRDHAVPVAAVARRARRSSTPRWCRTPGRTAGSSGRPSRSARSSRTLADLVGTRQSGSGRDPVRLGQLVGDRAGRDALRARVPDGGAALVPRAVAPRRARRLRAPGRDLSGYRVVIAPATHVLSASALEGLAAYTRSGGRLVVGYQTGILDEQLHVHLGGYLGALRDVLGVRVEEFAPPAAPSVSGGPVPTLEIAGLAAGIARGVGRDRPRRRRGGACRPSSAGCSTACPRSRATRPATGSPGTSRRRRTTSRRSSTRCRVRGRGPACRPTTRRGGGAPR